ncbi:GrpB family protein [Amycolatopsis sp. NEAU-NG30]|uniref:GrpB family protein n=1 Tax=Amycolatopsis melonis TaxID=3156488 RepID=A0ABV0LHA0_9PSEU
MQVTIADYDPAWPRMAAEAIAELAGALPDVFVAIEHIGSTAVPGLAAKPVIDLMAAVEDLEAAERREDVLAGLGFARHHNGMTDRLLYVRRRGGVRTHILHVVTLASWPTRNQRILRDHLRRHPGDAARYARLKRAVVAAGVGPGQYASAKTELVQELTDRARRGRGLPPVPVWEKGNVGGAGHAARVTRNIWDAEAATFDEQPDHGLRDPHVRAAWADLLLPLLPPAPAAVADLGCGTGSLSLLLAEAGYDVCGVDLSERMLDEARRKTAAFGAELRQGDAADPPCADHAYDVVLVRHVLWALPDPAAAVGRWVRLLAPGGRLVLVEGRWSTGAGLTAAECVDVVRAHRKEAAVRQLTDPALWGAEIDDERYVVVSRS